jgi:DNA-binding NtrC family response regulator
MNKPFLLVEDTPSLSIMYSSVLSKEGHSVEKAFTFNDGLAAYNRTDPDIVLLDLLLPDGDGQDLMQHMLQKNPKCKVIVITANGSINRAVDAMRVGAFDFLVKPFADARLIAAVNSALAANGKAPSAKKEKKTSIGFHGFIGTSPAMQSLYKMVDNIGQSSATVFISGESGTGKEVCAQTIHDVSNRSKGPFIALNCGAIPSDLLESEVFGHLKGSFTGAIADKIGAAQAADGGTLFLDEICEMDLSLQTKLLRFLQTSSIQPVGATTTKMVDARIICATNRNPMEQVRAGKFREDLYYRLHVVPVHIPPLRERGDDVLQIARIILRKFAEEEGKSFTKLSSEVEYVLQRYSWPGNVRQLLNALRNVAVLNNGETVTTAMLPAEILEDTGNIVQMPTTPNSESNDFSDALATPVSMPSLNFIDNLVGNTLADVERELIEATIAQCGGSIPKAAHMLDVSASTIYRKREAWARDTEKVGDP